MKYILLIGDGMADDGLDELGGKTPLEYAKTPALDAFAGAGTLGSVLTIPDGVPPGSDTATLTILGCDPREYYSGRAPIEAAASGIELEASDIAYRCNMVTLEDGVMPYEGKKLISHSAGSIEGEASDKLVSDLFAEPDFRRAAEAVRMEIFPGSSFRHIAVQRGAKHGPHPLTPPHDHLGEPIGGLLPDRGQQHPTGGGENAKILTDLMRLAHEILNDHPINAGRRKSGKLPANGIWFWAEGAVTKLPGFEARYGKSGSVIAAVPNCQGIGVLMGLTKIIVPGATGELNTNYEGKVDATIEALKTNDFAAIHIEAPDECTHDGDLQGKVQAIEWIDSRIAAPLSRKLQAGGTDYRLLAISDHRTLMKTRGHDGAPVPFVIYDSRHDNNTGLCFCETHAKKGVYIENGTELMRMLFNDNDAD